MKNKFLMMLALGFVTIAANAQPITVNFKPGPGPGEDAPIFISDGGCIFPGSTVPPADINSGNHTELAMIDWTFYSAGCSGGTGRSLINFTQLSSIPPSATIISATLKLYGVPSSGNFGNSRYPGSPYTPGDNRVYISMVTSPWNEATVTWNTQPSASPTPVIITPVSTTRWNWNYSNSSAALVSAIQDMVSNPGTNFGFQLKLEKEIHYRAMLFASSDHADSTLWPELEVVYTVCNANFTFCSDANNPYLYNFKAVDPAGSHLWEINGTPVDSIPDLTWTFGVGRWTVCHTFTDPATGDNCTRCFNLCIPQNSIYAMKVKGNTTKNDIQAVKKVIHGSFPQGDRNIYETEKVMEPKVMPNPTGSNWIVSVNANGSSSVTMRLTTMDGKVVYTKTHKLNAGQNNISVSGTNLSSGNYILEVIQNNRTNKLKLIKD